MPFRLVPKSSTLDDLELLYVQIFAEFCASWHVWAATTAKRMKIDRIVSEGIVAHWKYFSTMYRVRSIVATCGRVEETKQEATLSQRWPRDAPSIWVPWKIVFKRKISRQLRKNRHITILSLFGGEIINVPTNVIRVPKRYIGTDRRKIYMYCGIEEFQLMWSRYLIVTDGQTTSNLITALCVASRCKKERKESQKQWYFTHSPRPSTQPYRSHIRKLR